MWRGECGERGVGRATREDDPPPAFSPPSLRKYLDEQLHARVCLLSLFHRRKQRRRRTGSAALPKPQQQLVLGH